MVFFAFPVGVFAFLVGAGNVTMPSGIVIARKFFNAIKSFHIGAFYVMALSYF